MITAELKPCPFCSVRNVDGEEVLIFTTNGKHVFIKCWNCGATGRHVESPIENRTPIDDEYAKAVDAWNAQACEKLYGPTPLEGEVTADVERLAEIVSDYFAWRRWENMAEDKADLRLKMRGGDFDVNEPTKEQCREAARAAIAALQALPVPQGEAERCFAIMADVEAALVLTAEHNPTATVCSFVDSSTQFRDLAGFLHANQHRALTSSNRPTVDSLERVKAAIRKALTEEWNDAVNARSWTEDILLTGCQRASFRGYEKPNEAADKLAEDAARAAIEALGSDDSGMRAVLEPLAEKAKRIDDSVYWTVRKGDGFTVAIPLGVCRKARTILGQEVGRGA